MSGDAFFASFTGGAPGWARTFRRPHWQATARTVAAVPDLVRTAWGQAQAGAWVVLARATRLWCINSVRLWLPAELTAPGPRAG